MGMTSEDVVLSTKNLTKRFGKQTSVNNLNLEIKKGQIFGFLGPNGAGKTTTIRMLLGLMKPTEGEVMLFGQSLKENRVEILRRIGSLVESPSYYRNLTGYENLKIASKILKVSEKQIHKVLEIVRLTEDANRPTKQYSLGMKQRLGIAMALLGSPELLILDEPTNGLDPAGIQEIRELIRQLPGEFNITVMISSHNLNEIDMIASHVGIIKSGKMIFNGKIEDLRLHNKPVLVIEADNRDRAIRILSEWEHSIKVVGNTLHINGLNQSSADINEKLVLNGIKVSQIYIKSSTLEDIFLEMTGIEEEQ